MAGIVVDQESKGFKGISGTRMDLGYPYGEEIPKGFAGLEIKTLGIRMDLLILKKKVGARVKRFQAVKNFSKVEIWEWKMCYDES